VDPPVRREGSEHFGEREKNPFKNGDIRDEEPTAEAGRVNAAGMLPVMLRWLPTPLLALFSLASLGCEFGSGDSEGWGRAGVRVIREVSAGEGLRLLDDPETVLVQVREPTRRTNRVAGTEIVSARDPLPSHVTESWRGSFSSSSPAMPAW